MTLATKLEFFKAAYAEESLREQQLRTYSNNYLGLAAAYTGFLFFVVEKARPTDVLSWTTFVLTTCALSLGLALSLWVSKVARYEALFTPEMMSSEVGDGEDDFLLSRIADYAVACERNVKVNDRKATVLEFATFAFVAGVVLSALYFVILLHNGIHT